MAKTNNKNGESRWDNRAMIASIVIVIILIGAVAIFFYHYTRVAVNIPSSSTNNASVIAHIDLAVDKLSQWTGYWLSIISCVIALFTLIQAWTNYQSRRDTKKDIEDTKAENKKEYHEQKQELKELKKDYDHYFETFERRFKELSEEMKSSAYQNRLSCISACISSFPDAFSLTPTSERQRFTRSFLNMLFNEYVEYTYFVNRTNDCISVCGETGSTPHINPCREIQYVYLVWCDISIAVNHAMYDFSSDDQNIAFNDVRDLLSTAIRDYQRNRINTTNVAEWMVRIQEVLRQLIDVL